MGKRFKLQKIMMLLYIITAAIAFVYSLCFMTAYKDLFGLLLKSNFEIEQLHDVYLQGFNQILFWYTFFGVVSIVFFYVFGTSKYIPDLLAATVISVPLVVLSAFCVYSLLRIPELEHMYTTIDLSGLAKEGVVDYQIKTFTFSLGEVISLIQIIISLGTVFSQWFSFLGYKKEQKEVA